MEERRRGGFRVKPSFGQVLGYIQEGEPLALDLPKRNASIYTSSHFYLDDYPNAPEPVSETPLPHTSINPAAAFETADEGYDGVPFPRPSREFTRPSFLPDSDDGGTDPGQALRNDGLNPPRPPTLGGRLRESGIQAAETVIAGAAAGAAGSSNYWATLGSGAPAAASGAEGGGGGAPGGAGHRAVRLAADGGGGSNRRLRFGGGSGGRRSRDCGGRGNGRSSDRSGRGRPGGGRRCGRSDRGTGGCGGGSGRGLGHRGRSHRGLAHAGLGARRRAEARSDASRPSRATDVQTLNGMQDSGAVDHFFIQEQRQQPRVFRIDTDSESEPQAQPRQQIRARPIRRQGQGRQQPTPFGINQVPIPVSSGSERSRISRQSRGDRGPLATPSFDALRTASEPEAA